MTRAATPTCRLLRRPRRALIIFAGEASASDQPARVLEQRLIELGIETTYLGREGDAQRIAATVADERADAIEVCIGPRGHGVQLLRCLLRELIAHDRRDVSIVVHRAK